MKNIKCKISFLFIFLFSISCNSSSDKVTLEDVNLLDYFVPNICKSNVDCLIRSYESKKVRGFNTSTESIYTIKKDSVLLNQVVINPRNLLFNKKHIITKDRYHTYFHSVESPGVSELIFKVINGDYVNTKKLPTRKMEAEVKDISSLHILSESNRTRLFDTIYNNTLKRAIEIKGTFLYEGYENLERTNFIETIIEGYGTVQMIEKVKSDTIAQTVLDSLTIINREDMTTIYNSKN